MTKAKEIFTEEEGFDYPKLRGSIMKWAKNVEKIKFIDKNNDLQNVYISYEKYMRKNIDGWAYFITYFEENSRYKSVKEFVREFCKGNEEIKKIIQEKSYKVKKTEKKRKNGKEKGSNKWEKWEEESSEDTYSDGDEGKNGKEGSDTSNKTENDNSNTITGNDGKDGENTHDERGDGNEEDKKKKGQINLTDIDESPKKTENGDDKRKRKKGILDSDNRFKDKEIRNEVIQGNTWEKLAEFPTNSVDTVVTSPPYYGIRDYGDEADDVEIDGWYGQLGGENHERRFIKNMMAIIERLDRVIKPTGSFFLNIGDTVEDGSARLIPERIYHQMIKNGWILRNRIIWVKQLVNEEDTIMGSLSPSSTRTCLNRKGWEPVFWFVKSKDYWQDIASVRVEHKTELSSNQGDYSGKYEDMDVKKDGVNSARANVAKGNTELRYHGCGSLIPEVWKLPPTNSEYSHTSMFSEELVERPVKMTCPQKVCIKCGRGYEREPIEGDDMVEVNGIHDTELVKKCRCDTEETKPGIVMDPFMGRGTTAKVACDNGRDYTGIEISERNIEIIEDFVPDTKQVRL